MIAAEKKIEYFLCEFDSIIHDERNNEIALTLIKDEHFVPAGVRKKGTFGSGMDDTDRFNLRISLKFDSFRFSPPVYE